MRKTRLLLCSLVGLAATPAAPSAWAVALDATACEVLEKEKSALETAGTQADMRLKPDEAKALGEDRLKRIQHYIDVSGSVLFRCSSVAPQTGSLAKSPAAASPTSAIASKADAGKSATVKRVVVKTKRHKR